MGKIKVLLLGGSYAQIPLIQECKNRGYYTIICDYLSDNPGREIADEYYNVSTTDFEEVLNLAKALQPDLVLAYASDPAAPTAAFVSEKLGLPGNSYKSVRILGEKDLFRQFLKKEGFNYPKGVSIDLENWKEAIGEVKTLKFPVIIKPTDSSGSKGVCKVVEPKEIKSSIKYAKKFSRNGRILAEEFIDTNNEQIHGDGFIEKGKLIFSHLGDHHYNSEINPFVPYSTTWPSTRSSEIIKAVEEEVSKIILKAGFNMGGINIEARVDKDQKIYIMEIGPRSGGNFVPQVIEYSTDFNMVKAFLDVSLGRVIDQPKQLFCRPSAYYVIHAEQSGFLESIVIKDVLKQYIKEYHQYVNIGEEVESFQSANRAIGLVLLTFPTDILMHRFISNMQKYIIVKVK